LAHSVYALNPGPDYRNLRHAGQARSEKARHGAASKEKDSHFYSNKKEIPCS
jgi:hypothetical protein